MTAHDPRAPEPTYLPHCAGPCRCSAGTITDADGSVEHVDQGEDCDCFPDDAGTACVHCGAALSTQSPVYAWRRRSRTDEHAATITLARRTDGCDVCAGLGRPRTTTGRPCVYCGAPLDDLLLVVDSTQEVVAGSGQALNLAGFEGRREE